MPGRGVSRDPGRADILTTESRLQVSNCHLLSPRYRLHHCTSSNSHYPSEILLGKGLIKIKKKYGIFHKGGGVPPDFGSVSILFLFIFKHGLNHPEMQRNFFYPLVTPPPSSFLQQIDYISLGVPLELAKGTPEKKKKKFLCIKTLFRTHI